eukprot:Pompholyxophrys_punicea_v1_NODE_107_length_3448_cov_2.539935.p2 type:complete len:128 gc:universal NODE_107_length_3448_cov_2.539935:912-529(-)
MFAWTCFSYSSSFSSSSLSSSDSESLSHSSLSFFFNKAHCSSKFLDLFFSIVILLAGISIICLPFPVQTKICSSSFSCDSYFLKHKSQICNFLLVLFSTWEVSKADKFFMRKKCPVSTCCFCFLTSK